VIDRIGDYMRHWQVQHGAKVDGVVRISMLHTNTAAEVERPIAALERVL
jgi:selenocysteine lyase/cysteine desulfurase